jgi:hypothetical protein
MNKGPRAGIAKRAFQAPIRHLLGVELVSDVYERLSELGVRPPLDAKRRGWLERIHNAGVLFIHVPKNAGMSINTALYGRHIPHATIRYYARVAPELVERLPSVAVLRDPVERFVSAYNYACAGGSHDNAVSEPFRSRYCRWRSIDEALDHVAAVRHPYALDHIFRPQRWFLSDASGRIAVRELIRFDRLETIGRHIPQGRAALAHINRGSGRRVELGACLVERLREIYARDFELYEGLGAGAPEVEVRAA